MSPVFNVFADPLRICEQRILQSPKTFIDSAHSHAGKNDTQIKKDACGILYAEMRSQVSTDGKPNQYWLEKLSKVSSSSRMTTAPTVLHSDPEATRKIYLSFSTIGISTSSWWYGYWNNISSMQGFSLDADFSTFSEAENSYIYKVWSDVAEDFAGLDVDVTTENPGVSGLTRSDSYDLYYGMTAHISSDYSKVAECGCGGVAYMSMFDAIWNTSENFGAPVWNFASHYAGYTLAPEDTAGIVSHELGHSVGLDHDGTSNVGYYGGHSNGLWGPIMGTTYNRAISQWSINEYADGRRTGSWQNGTSNDDFQAMVATGLPLRIDDFGSTIISATTLTATTGSFLGVIGSDSDKDFFKLVLGSSATLRFDVTNYLTLHPNLDIKLEIFRSDGSLEETIDIPVSRQSNNSAIGLNASINTRLTSGAWYIAISGTGARDPSTTGYSSYSSVGRYSVDYAWTTVVAPAPVINSIGVDRRIIFTQPQEDSFSTITRYEYSLAGSSDDSSYAFGSWIDAGIGPRVRSFIPDNIQSGYSYRVKLRAVEGTTVGEESLASTMLTAPSAPLLTTYTYLAGVATVNFSPSIFGGTTSLGYSYSLSADSGVTWGEWWKYTPSKSLIQTSPISIASGFVSGKIYKLKLRASNKVGFSSESAFFDIDTRVIPRINSINPIEGLTGTVIQVTGQDFVDISNVFFGSVPASFTVLNTSSMLITVPSGFIAERIMVVNPVGNSLSSAIFTLKFPPIISGFTPETAVPNTLVTISGVNLSETRSVVLNGKTLALQSITSSAVIVRIPEGATTGRLVITTAWGSTTSSTDLTIPPPPTITSFSPNIGKPTDPILITGTNFYLVTQVTINGLISEFTVLSSTQIRAFVPYGFAEGKWRVVAYAGTAVSQADFIFRKSD